LFSILETQNLLNSQARITLLPRHSGVLAPLLAARETPQATQGAVRTSLTQ